MKNFFKGIIFMLLLLVLMEGSAILFLPGNNVRKYGLYNVSAYEIMGEKENTIDVIAVGDSLVYSSLSPMEVWNSFGFTLFDCAEAAQIIPDTYEYLKVAIESQKPKIVLMEANILFRDPSKREWHKKVTKKLKNYVPIVKYHDNWKKYISDGKKSNWINVNKGYKYITKVKPSKPRDYMKPNNKFSTLPVGNLEYFEKIVKMCEDHNVKLVLVSFPTQNAWSYKKHNGAKKIADQFSIDFIDLNLEDLGIDWETDTKDEGSHLNYLGAKKVSNYIGNYLKTTGLVIDHRNDSDYSSWNKAYKMYYKESIKNGNN